MDNYKELLWFWYIFENRTLADTHTLLASAIRGHNSQPMGHEGISLYRKGNHSSMMK